MAFLILVKITIAMMTSEDHGLLTSDGSALVWPQYMAWKKIRNRSAAECVSWERGCQYSYEKDFRIVALPRYKKHKIWVWGGQEIWKVTDIAPTRSWTIQIVSVKTQCRASILTFICHDCWEGDHPNLQLFISGSWPACVCCVASSWILFSSLCRTPRFPGPLFIMDHHGADMC